MQILSRRPNRFLIILVLRALYKIDRQTVRIAAATSVAGVDAGPIPSPLPCMTWIKASDLREFLSISMRARECNQ